MQANFSITVGNIDDAQFLAIRKAIKDALKEYPDARVSASIRETPGTVGAGGVRLSPA